MGLRLSSTKQNNFHLVALMSLLFATALATNTNDTLDIVSVFYRSGRVFQEAPVEGIILQTSTSTDAYLVNGTTDDLVSTFVFKPPSGTSPQQYTMAFTCDSDVVSTSDSCLITNALASILDSEDNAYNTTVTCAFDQFPGNTSCSLTATLIVSTRAQVTSISNLARQTAFYKSPAVSYTIYGVVLYIPDSSGGISSTASVVSGDSAYQLSQYDRSVQAVRKILLFVSVPGSSETSGSSALSFLSEATIATEAQDKIFNYDDATCSVTGASFSGGTLSLTSASACGIGIAVETETSYPTMGFQFRAYKSGNFTYKMFWNSFGTSGESYEQSISFRITEDAPPVVTSVNKQSLYRSVPCGSETLVLTAYNVRYADNRTIVVTNSDDTTVVWSETAAGFSYDSATDISTLTFESAGGSGTNIDLILDTYFGSEARTGVVLDSSISLTLSFSTPPTLTSMSPLTSNVAGGDIIVLTGTFEGFDSEDFVFIGGYPISGSDVSIDSSTQIAFATPAMSTVGMSYIYGVAIGICAEMSSSISLSYLVEPSVTITAVNSSYDDTGTYIVPLDNSASFLAEVSGNNDGVEYTWKILLPSGSDVSTGDTVTNLQQITVSSALLTSGETYQLQCQVNNSLNLTASSAVSIALSESGVVMLTNVYTIENRTRAADSDTIVQSSVQVTTNSGSVVALQSSSLSLEWSYLGKKFKVDESLVDSDVTGPTQLGLEFNIARGDLQVGSQELALFAYLSDDPTVNGTDMISVHVSNSALMPVINSGVNGTLILEGNDLQLSGSNSTDPDVFDGEGIPSDGLSYEWINCAKSLKSTFSSGVSNCTAILPEDTNSVEITILASELANARMDTSSDPDPTFFSFGLRVSKEDRSAEAYAYFAFWSIAQTEEIPTLSSLQVVDVKGVPLITTEVNIFADIIIQPESSDPLLVWSFDMLLASQKYLFSKNGILKTSNGFVSSRGIQSRNLLGFTAGSLSPAMEYKVRVSATTESSSLKSDYEVSFKTADAPILKCTPPQITTGIVSETRFTVTAMLSFEAPSIEYCFLLVISQTQKYSVGKGCSSVPFAEFSFSQPGEYEIECVAKTVSGAEVDKVVLPGKIVLSTPTPTAGNTVVQTLADRLKALNARATGCELYRDHNCIDTLIAAAASFGIEVAEATTGATSEEALVLIDDYKTYFERMSMLSSSLASKTVYRPNQLMDSIDKAFYMSQVPAEYVLGDETLFAFLKSAASVANATDLNSEAVVDNVLVDKVSGIANLSLSTSSSLAQQGTTRRRLLQNEISSTQSFMTILHLATNNIAVMRAQQETCGYSGTETTAFPSSLGGEGRSTSIDGNDVPPLEVLVQVSCTQTQISQRMAGAKVSLKVCEEALSSTELRRTVVKVVGVPSSAIERTGLLDAVTSYVDYLAFVELDGVKTFPANCLQIIMERNSTTLVSTQYDDLVGGFLDKLPDVNTICTPETCYVFDSKANLENKVTFSDKEVVIQARRGGLFVAGNKTETRTVPPATLDGFITNVGTQFLGILSVLLAFVVFAVLFVWLAVTRIAVVGAPEGDNVDAPIAVTSWEYVERDPFARDQRKDSLFTETEPSLAVPEGAQPPEAGPMSPKA